MNVICPAHLNTLDMLDAEKYPQRQELSTRLATRATRTTILEQLSGMINQAFEQPKTQETKDHEELVDMVRNIGNRYALYAANITMHAKWQEVLQAFEEHERANTTLDKVKADQMSDK